MNDWIWWLGAVLTFPFWFGVFFVALVRVIEVVDRGCREWQQKRWFEVWQDYLDWAYHIMGGEGRFQ